MAGPSAIPLIRYDLARHAVVTSVVSATQFTCAALIGLGQGSLIGSDVYVLRDTRTTATALSAPQGEQTTITAFDTLTGTVTHAAFTVPMLVGAEILILHPAIAAANHLNGQATVAGAVTANWQAAEQDLVTIGTNGVSYKLHMLLVTIANLAGNIAIRAYHRVNGVERRYFPIPANTTFTAAASAPAIRVYDTTGAITEALRITIQSDNVVDNGQAVDYEYKLELM